MRYWGTLSAVRPPILLLSEPEQQWNTDLAPDNSCTVLLYQHPSTLTYHLAPPGHNTTKVGGGPGGVGQEVQEVLLQGHLDTIRVNGTREIVKIFSNVCRLHLRQQLIDIQFALWGLSWNRKMEPDLSFRSSLARGCGIPLNSYKLELFRRIHHCQLFLPTVLVQSRFTWEIWKLL